MTSRTPVPADEIMHLEREACRLIKSGHIDEMVDSIISTNGLLFSDGGGIVAGREAQRTLFKEFLGARYQIDFEPTAAFASGSGDMAWAYGTYRLTAPDGTEDIGKYVSVWAKEGGLWKNVAEMRNSNGPTR